MSFAIGYGPYLAMLADLVPEDRRSRVGGVLNIGNMLGQLAILVVAMQLWSSDERLVFWMVAGALLAGFAITVLFVPERRLTEAPPPLRFEPGAYFRGIFAHREVMKYLFATLFFWFGTAGVVPFITRFAVTELDTTEAAAFQRVAQVSKRSHSSRSMRTRCRSEPPSRKPACVWASTGIGYPGALPGAPASLSSG